MKTKVNVIEEYFKEQGDRKQTFSELFEASEDDIDTKTDLTPEKIVLITTLYENDLFLMKKGLKPLFKSYYEKYMRLMISKDRQSRTEFVDINRNKKDEDITESLRGLIQK